MPEFLTRWHQITTTRVLPRSLPTLRTGTRASSLSVCGVRRRTWRPHRKALRARLLPALCACCGLTATQLHHRTYERVGCEDDGDLVAVCRECHGRIHLLCERGEPLWSAHATWSKHPSLVAKRRRVAERAEQRQLAVARSAERRRNLEAARDAAFRTGDTQRAALLAAELRELSRRA